MLGSAAAPPRAERRKKSSLQEIVETLLLAVLIFVAVRSVVLNYRVDGMSMEPSLQNGEMLIVNRRAYSHVNVNALLNLIPGVSVSGTDEWYLFHPPQRGDIVVFHPPGQHSEPYIKRIIGLPGDRVAIHDGAVYINGKRLEEPYLASQTVWRGIAAHQEITVQPGQVFVLGDNRGNSSDSRVFGPVPISQIIGKAWIAYWPPSQMQILPHPHYTLD
ncbi:MAG: signal peptidase I [Thermomicrobiaceae bacterium]|nr:signal peptidase I [Thermomicrobiaceae bacterium]